MPAAAPAPEHAEPLLMQFSVFPAAASLQTGFPLRSNRFQLFLLTPDTWYLDHT